MKKLLSFLFTLSGFTAFLSAQVTSNIQTPLSINESGNPPATSAIVDIDSNSKGLLIPRMTLVERNGIINPATGLMIYQTDSPAGFYYFDGTAWVSVISGVLAASSIQDADGDTKVQTEENPDEDVIRFDIAGIEKMALIQNGNGAARLELYDNGLNTAVGDNAGFNLNPLSTFGNTFYGGNSGYFTNTGENNTASGYESLYLNQNGSYNTATGFHAMISNVDGFDNAAFGIGALHENSSGSNNAAVGAYSLFSNQNGSNNTAVGANALNANTDRSGLVAIGANALINNGINATAPVHATANTAVGTDAMLLNTIGHENTATGYTAMYSNDTGARNAAHGFQALYSNSFGNDNTAIGFAAMYSNRTASDNCAMGKLAMYYNQSGNDNSTVGSASMFNNISGTDNSAIGFFALFGNTTGSFNTAVGTDANSVGSNYSNSTGLGYNADCTASNQVRIGNSAVTQIGGYTNWTNVSDSRFKTNVAEDVKGLEFINKLRPVTYKLDIDSIDDFFAMHYNERDSSDYALKYEKKQIRYSGFLAQEVESVARQVGYNFSGVDAPKNDKDFYGLRYAAFVVPLVKAVQEQQEMIARQNTEIETVKAENATLKNRLNAIEALLKNLKAPTLPTN